MFQINKPSTPLKEKPLDYYPIENELLFGESIKVTDKTENWVFVTTSLDNYKGWILEDSIGGIKKNTHRVLSIRTFVFEKPDIKSYCLSYLPIGSQVKVNKYNLNWSEISLDNAFNKKKGFILNNNIVKISHKVEDWVTTAESFLRVPYRWGGRNSIGLDCSALIQLSLQTAGFTAPRDTKFQSKILCTVTKNVEEIKRGTIIFWEGHVGVMIDKYNILHANAFHMNVTIELLEKAKKRLQNDVGNIKKILNLDL